MLKEEIFEPAIRDTADPIERIYGVLQHSRRFLLCGPARSRIFCAKRPIVCRRISTTRPSLSSR
jgi:hypothetical protein